MTEPDVLDTAQELQSLQKTLRESGRKLLFRAEVATVRNFRFLVRVCLEGSGWSIGNSHNRSGQVMNSFSLRVLN